MRLAELQKRFQAAILNPTLLVTDAELGIKTVNGANPQRRIGIHHYGYWSKMMRFVRSKYPLTAKLMGDSAFNDAVTRYMVKYPSRTFSPGHVAPHFEMFLRQTIPWKKYPVLAELAKYDWVRSNAANGPEESFLRLEQLDEIEPSEWQDVKIRLSLRAGIVETRLPIPELDIKLLTQATKLARTKKYMVLYSENRKMRFKVIDKKSFLCLQYLAKARSLKAFMRRMKALKVSAVDTDRYLRDWVKLELIVPVQD